MEWPALKQLASKQYQGLSDQVKSYFNPPAIRSSKRSQQEAEVKVLCSSAQRFLTQCCPLLANHNGPVDQELLAAIKICCQGFSGLCHLADVSSNATCVLKTLLYIISKLNGKTDILALQDLGTSILHIVRSFSCPESDIQVSDLVSKLYSILWNAAIAFERQGQSPPLAVCQLRLLSVRLLSQCSSSEDYLEKAVLALNVFERRFKEKVSIGKGSTGGIPDSKSVALKAKTSKLSLSKKTPKGKSADNSEDGLVSVILQDIYSLLDDELLALKSETKIFYVLKLIITVYDFLSSTGIFEEVQKLKKKLHKVAADLKEPDVVGCLEQFFSLSYAVECLFEHFPPLPGSASTLSIHLASTHNWSQKLRKELDGNLVRWVTELLSWFIKQMKSRTVRKEVICDMASLAALLNVLSGMQELLAKAACDSAQKDVSTREQLTKTWLDAHRSWIILFLNAATELPDFENKELEKMVHASLDQLEAYRAAIDSSGHFVTNQLNERYYLGSSCVKLGHLMYNKSKDRESIPYYRTACQQLLLWCQGTEASQLSARLRESCLLKLYNCLSQSLLKVGQIDEAMDVIVLAVRAAKGCLHEYEDLAVLVKTWVRLKRAAFRESGADLDNELEKRCARSFTESDLDISIHKGLIMELEAMLKSPRQWPVIRIVLKRLVETSDADMSEDVFKLLFIQCELFIKSKDKQFLTESCLDVDCILARNEQNPEVCAEAFLLRFCLQVFTKLQDDEEDVETKQQSKNQEVGKQQGIMGEEERELIEASLRCWRQALGAQGETTQLAKYSVAELVMFRDMLMTVADIMMACREFTLQLDLLATVKLMSNKEMWTEVEYSVRSCLLDLLALVSVQKAPGPLVEDVLSRQLNVFTGSGRDADNLMLAVVHFYVKTGGDLSAVLPVLNTLRDKDLKGELSTLQRGQYNRILGQCLLHPPDTLPLRPDLKDDTSMTYAQNAYRCHFSLFSRSAKENVSSGFIPGEDSLWRKLVECLQSTLFLGCTYRHCGDHKRARCYLKEGLALARRTLVFGVEVAELLMDTESLESVVETLRMMLELLSHVEPPLALPVGEHGLQKARPSIVSCLSQLSLQTGNMAEDTGSVLQQQLYEAAEEGGCPSFWQVMHKYKRTTEDDKPKMSEAKEEALKLAVMVTTWAGSLASHEDSCRCRSCNDFECQRLALKLTVTCFGIIHSLSTLAEHPVKRFLGEDLIKLHQKCDNNSQRFVLMLQNVGVLEKTVSCSNWSALLCVAQLSYLLAESHLRQDKVAEALVHSRIAWLAARKLPFFLSEANKIQIKIVCLQAACANILNPDLSIYRHRVAGAHDINDTWCWLNEAQLEAAVRKRLDLLKVRKVDITQPVPQNSASSSQQKQTPTSIAVVESPTSESSNLDATVDNSGGSVSPVLADVPQKSTRGGRRVTRRAGARKVLIKPSDIAALEVEAVRAGDDDYDVGKDVFDFAESDDDSCAFVCKGKGRQKKAPGTKKGAKKEATKSSSTFTARGVKSRAPGKSKAASSKRSARDSSTKKTIESVKTLTVSDIVTEPLTEIASPTDLTIETVRMCEQAPLKNTRKSALRCETVSTPQKDESDRGTHYDLAQSSFDSMLWKEKMSESVKLITNIQAKGPIFDKDDSTDDTEALSLQMKELALGNKDALMQVQCDLKESLRHIMHFPYVSGYSEGCKLLAQLQLHQAPDPWETAALLSESIAVSLRHQFLAHYKKLIRLQDGEAETAAQDVAELKENVKELLFPWNASRYREAVQSLPAGWTVCQFTVVDHPVRPTLLLTRLTRDRQPFTMELPRFSDHKGQEIYFGFKEILLSNDESWKMQDRAQWWSHRAQSDATLANVLEGMEKHWLGSWKGLLAAQTMDSQYNKAVQKAAASLTRLVPSHLGCSCSLQQALLIVELAQFTKDLITVLQGVLNTEVSSSSPFLQVMTTKVLDLVPSAESRDLPVLFILDKHLINFPLEQMAVCRQQSITRLPSLPLLTHLLYVHNRREDSVYRRGVDPTNVFYLLNPDGDLQHSIQLLGPHFSSFTGWQGISNTAPTKGHYRDALTKHDLLIYAGHGSGSKYFSVEDLCKVKCRAVPLLFGCGSVRFDLHPNLDADAYFTGYLLAGSPCVLGNLWEVTDKDIDTFALHMFQQWLQEGRGTAGTLSLAHLVQKARAVCRMQWLNGSAPVVYGLPVHLNTPAL